MADQDKMVEETENNIDLFYDLITQALEVGNKVIPKNIENLVDKNVRRSPSLRRKVENRQRFRQLILQKFDEIKKTEEALDKMLKESQESSMTVQASKNEITPEDASKIDGVKVKEVSASDGINLQKLVDVREEGRRLDPISGKKDLPGNRHSEIQDWLGGKGIVEASLTSEEKDLLKGLYE